MEIYLSPEEVRSIILNSHKIKKDHRCSMCKGTGWVNWDEEGENAKPGWSDSPNRNTEECESCDGVGYIDITLYSEG